MAARHIRPGVRRALGLDENKPPPLRREVGRDQPAALASDHRRVVAGVASAGRDFEHGISGPRCEFVDHPLAYRGGDVLDARGRLRPSLLRRRFCSARFGVKIGKTLLGQRKLNVLVRLTWIRKCLRRAASECDDLLPACCDRGSEEVEAVADPRMPQQSLGRRSGRHKNRGSLAGI